MTAAVVRSIGFALVMLTAGVTPAAAQQSLTEVLSFLLTNRSIPTGDFAGDQQAAAATRDAIAGLLRDELSTLPFSSPVTGFTYRLDPTLGANVRSSDSFGPFYTESSLTAGRGQIAFGIGFTRSSFDNIDGRKLGTGTLVATASRFIGTVEPFDAETLALRIRTRSVTVSAHAGLTDRLDLMVAVPFATVSLSGERVDTYYGTPFVQATALSSTSGLGDVIVRSKYNVLRRASGGVTVAAEARIASGDSANLLGGGEHVIMPRLIASFEQDRVALHGNLGYAIGGRSGEVGYRGAVTVAASPRITIIGEILGRRLGAGGRLTNLTAPHPDLTGVETIRLSATEQATSRATMVAGVRWNIAARWLVSASVLKPLTSTGLNARWVPTASLDYSWER